MNNYATLEDLLRAQEQAKFEAGRYGMNEFYSPQMSMAAQPNMSPVNPQQATQSDFDFNKMLDMARNAQYAGLAPIQHNVSQVSRGGQIIEPMQAEMTPAGTGMMGLGPKKDDKEGLLNMLMKAFAGA